MQNPFHTYWHSPATNTSSTTPTPGAFGKLFRLAPLALIGALALAAFSCGGIASAAPASAQSATQSASHITKTTRADALTLSAAQCATERKAYPDSTCALQHTVTETDVTPDTGGATPFVIIGGGGGCYVGDKYFTDTYTNADEVAYQLQISTHFHWDGSCGQPAGVSVVNGNPACQVNWTAPYVGFSNPQCYYWHSNEFNATEGKYLVFVSLFKIGGGYTAGVYRGCRPDTSCYEGWV